MTTKKSNAVNTQNDILYIGVNDHLTDLFEGQYSVPNGMSYNSYLILDEKTAVTDTVDARFGGQWLDNLETALAGRLPDYLIVHHMEPDHSASIADFCKKYPNAVIAATAKAFTMMDAFFGSLPNPRLTVKDGSVLPLGRHELSFITAPMVHWPEVAVSYDRTDGILFSADAFGKFGALDADEPWDDEARRYYIGIVGKYGAPAAALLKKAAALDIRTICPLHGPVLKENLAHYINLYATWSSYTPEESGVAVCVASVYGHTARAAEALADALRKSGTKAVVYDLARCDMSAAVADAFRFDRLVLASPTYNGDVFPCMHAFLHALVSRSFRNRRVGLIENGSWAPMAAKVMQQTLSACEGIEFLPAVTVRSAMNDQSVKDINALAQELLK
jgi:hypothetical protein